MRLLPFNKATAPAETVRAELTPNADDDPATKVPPLTLGSVPCRDSDP